MRSPLLLLLLCLCGCEITPDPCSKFDFACIAVTVQSGPQDAYQLQVIVEGYSSSTPLTPRRIPKNALIYPLRFAIQFTEEFDRQHKGQVIVDVSALDQNNNLTAQARQQIAIRNGERQSLTLTLGEPLDLAEPAPPPDLRPPVDMATADLAQPVDLAQPDLSGPDLLMIGR